MGFSLWVFQLRGSGQWWFSSLSQGLHLGFGWGFGRGLCRGFGWGLLRDLVGDFIRDLV